MKYNIIKIKLLIVAVLILKLCFAQDPSKKIDSILNSIKVSDNKIYLKTGDTMGQSSIIAYNRTEKWGLVKFINERNSKLRNNLINSFYELFLN